MSVMRTMLLAGLLLAMAPSNWHTTGAEAQVDRRHPLAILADQQESDTELPSRTLSPSEAFPFTAWHDGSQAYIGFEVEDGHYLYRDELFLSSTAEGVSTEVHINEGAWEEDDFFGRTRVYRDATILTIPLIKEPADSLRFDLTFTGCAYEVGICYPPEEIQLEAVFREQTPFNLRGAHIGGDHRISLLAKTGSGEEGARVAHEQRSESTGQSSAPRAAGVPASGSSFSGMVGNLSLPTLIAITFLAGLALTFTPCVLPMVPIVTSVIVGQQASRGRAAMLSTSYVAGMAATYTALGLAMATIGAGMNIQAYLQSPWVIAPSAALMFVLAVAMSGQINLASSRLNGMRSRVDALQARAQAAGAPGSAVAGGLSVLVLSPCVSAPLVAILAFVASGGSIMTGGIALMALALGMGLPLILVGVFGATLMPRPGPWMEGVKRAFALMMAAMGVWLLGRILPPPVILAGWAILLLLAASWMGLFRPVEGSHRPVLRALALVPATWALAMLVGASAGNSNPLQPLASLTSPGMSQQADQGQADIEKALNIAEIREIVATTRTGDQRPVMVTFTADWCSSCKVMERRLEAVPEELSHFRRVEVDVTHASHENREMLSECGLYGPPGMLFFGGGERLDADLYGEVDVESLRHHLKWVQDVATTDT